METRETERRPRAPGPTTAVVLSGGGARGAYQVGVLRWIARQYPDLRIPVLTGVSAGAINAAYLAGRPGVLVSKREIMAEVWRQPYGRADKTVDVHLSWLRKKLGESAASPRYLETVHGVGVKLVDPT